MDLLKLINEEANEDHIKKERELFENCAKCLKEIAKFCDDCDDEKDYKNISKLSGHLIDELNKHLESYE